MKEKSVFKGFLTVVALVVGIIALAAGVAVFVDRMLKRKECSEGYIECDCTPDSDDCEITAE